MTVLSYVAIAGGIIIGVGLLGLLGLVTCFVIANPVGIVGDDAERPFSRRFAEHDAERARNA